MEWFILLLLFPPSRIILMADIDQWHQQYWKNIYPVVWLDAIRYKIKQDLCRVQSKVLLAIGLKLDGKRSARSMDL